MIYIYKELIKNYINNLSINDIKNYADKNNIIYTNKELLIVYDFIKEYHIDILNNNTEVFNILKNKISNNLYSNLLDLYNTYKKYI